MNEHQDRTLERVSALIDGELPAGEVAQAVQTVMNDEAQRAALQMYQLVGETLRTGRHTACTDGDAFLARLRARMESEPPVLRPAVAAVPAPPARPEPMEAANEPVFRWRLVAGVASVAVAAAVGWSFVGGAGGNGGAQLARQDGGAPVLAASGGNAAAPATAQNLVQVGNRPEVMLRDPRLDELLEAHQQAGGASQMPSGFLRNATFESPAR